MAHTRPSRSDKALLKVCNWLRGKPDLAPIVGGALRQAFDEVIDGRRTGRYQIEQLEKTEKTYIGTKVEIILRNALELDRGTVLDNKIAGVEVDTKFSLRGEWMIPAEAIGEICLLVSGDDHSGLFQLGLLRTARHVLRDSANRDGKRGVSALGKRQITWLVPGGARLPQNFLLSLPTEDRKAILSPRSGSARIRELFRRARRMLISRSVIEQVARQHDSLRRARAAKAALAAEGIQVLCATYISDRCQFQRNGFADFNEDDWLSI